ncbi:MAG: peptide ABC transporter substrate-binding protein, partial [Thermomicrobiales bacterium]
MAKRFEPLTSRRTLLKTGAAATAMLAAGRTPGRAFARAQAATQVLRLPASPLISTGPFDLGLIGGGPGIQMANLMFEGLTVYDWNSKQVLPAAAERWEVSEDNLTYTFFLRPGMIWSDGSPLTAHDYEFAIKRNLDPALGGPLTTYLYPLEGAQEYNTGATDDPDSVAVTATDDLTLEMVMTGVTPYWPVMLALWTAFPINQASIDAGGPNWMEPRYLITNGRYTMESWEDDQSMVLVRNESFHGTKPTIERIEYTLFQDPNEQALASFETGEVDVAPVSAAKVDFVASDPDLSELRQTYPVSGTWHLRLDMSNQDSILSNVDVRKALYLAIDRDLLANQVLKGVPAPSLVHTSPDIPSYDSNVGLAGTVEDAKAMLAAAGFPDGNDFPGFRLGYVPTQENAQLVSEALVQMWNDNLGITTVAAFAVPTDWRQRIRT